jgi:hypothetical protein
LQSSSLVPLHIGASHRVRPVVHVNNGGMAVTSTELEALGLSDGTSGIDGAHLNATYEDLLENKRLGGSRPKRSRGARSPQPLAEDDLPAATRGQGSKSWKKVAAAKDFTPGRLPRQRPKPSERANEACVS